METIPSKSEIFAWPRNISCFGSRPVRRTNRPQCRGILRLRLYGIHRTDVYSIKNILKREFMRPMFALVYNYRLNSPL